MNQIIRCERCNEKLNPKKVIWLELSITDGKYYSELPEGHESQGGFSFGKACSIKQLQETITKTHTTMKKVKIQLNELFCEQRPTTQEDNYGGIRERWDLFEDKKYSQTNKEHDIHNIGKMVQYMNGNYAIFVSGLRFDLPIENVQFN